jgi:FemAB-related protein (PEP-CTERM system-associated)
VPVERVPEPGPEWDAFAESRPDATLGHAAAWAGVLCNAYGLEPLYLAVREGSGELRGVLPLVAFRGLRGARELVSLPFLDTAGILARDRETESRLLAAALEQAHTLGARVLELRQLRPLSGLEIPPTPRVDLALSLPGDEEELWRRLPGKVRNQTRKAGREGLVVAEGETEAELLTGFYEVYRRNMRDLGSPAHGLEFFREAARGLGSRLRVVVARRAGRPVGGLVAIRFGGRVSVPWASTLRAERPRCPNNLIYWEALRWAIAQRASEFDFGRSPAGSGSHRFKLGWGAVERPLAWTRLDADGRPVRIHPPADSALLRAFARLWKTLPAPVSNRLGPRVRRRLSS